MSDGQMIAQMFVGVPSAAAMPVASPVTAMPGDGQEAGAFAGLLGDMSAHPAATSLVIPLQAGNSEAAEIGLEPASAKTDASADVMAVLLAMVGTEKEVAASSSVTDETLSEQPKEPGKEEGKILQNVNLFAAGLQMVAMQQINGRMPEPIVTEQAVTDASGKNAATTQTAGIAEIGGSFRGHAGAISESVAQSPAFVGILTDSYNILTPTMQQNAVASASTQQETSAVQEIAPSTPQPAADIMVSRKPSADTTASPKPFADILMPQNAVVQEPVRNVLQEMPVTSVKVVSAPPSVSKQPETVPTENVAKPVVETTVASSGGSTADIVVAGKAVSPQPVMDTVAVARDIHATPAVHIAVDGKRSDPRAEQEIQTSKPDAADAVDGLESCSNENVAAVAIKKGMASTNEESFGQDGKGTSGQKTGVQDNMMLLHQMKAESPSAVAGASKATASEPVRANVMEQVVSHLTASGVKNGAEQVVIRLSPENLGELKLNLRMENQCLKVEIVAENNQVRDSLIKHSDTLKEALARQNIAMETFDVSTGNGRNGAASYGQGQRGWQELTQRQQNAAWNTSGSHRVSDAPEIPQRPLYQASARHSMVDVHF